MAAALAVVTVALAGLVAVASADNLTSDAATTTGITTFTAGDSTTITYQLVANSAPSGDASGCDATAAKPVTVTINAPAAVSAPASLSFTGCGNANTKAATFSSSTPGSYSITHSISGGVTGSKFNDQADFTLTVNAPPPPPNTAPTLALPSDIGAEATGPDGATVTYTATADDNEDGALAPTCSPASGTKFALGITQVNCAVTDSGGLTTTGMFNVIVRDTTPPSLSLPGDITKEATGPNGAPATFTATATDIVDGILPAGCDHSSGDTFPLGTTTVTCSATDGHGNSASGTFDVTVVDTTPPDLNLPSDTTAEATGPNGAAVTFTATANDVVDGGVPVVCDHSSGDTFPLGTTTVSCSATDAHSNAASGSFKVTVQDTTPPALSLPADISVFAASNSQATVTYSASASDLVDGPVPVSCQPSSGSSFSAGTTTVNCSATDAHGNTGTGSFKVAVSYNWSGFFQPIDNGVMNVAKAGSTIPAKFSLGGDQGLNILYSSAYPSSGSLSCSADSTTDAIEEYSTTTVSGLKYDSLAGQYIYNWKTTSSWAGTCRQLIVRLADGTYHRADFKFTK
jgi:HYR domain